ncbi:putative N6-adenine methyltransferase-domain-containing protein [Dipodascopsis uninucleata]
MNGDAEEEIRLPADTQALLEEFRKEEAERVAAFERIAAAAEAQSDALKSMDLFTEDWQMSQFWYTDETARELSLWALGSIARARTNGREIKGLTKEPGVLRIAVVSAPTVHQYLTRVILPELSEELKSIGIRVESVVFEFDERFAVFGDDQFEKFDFNRPMAIRSDMQGRFDVAIVDPPFLSEECQIKTALSVRLLLGDPSANNRIVVCTGEKVADVVLRAYRAYGLKRTSFFPAHRNGLQNDFRSFSTDGLAWGSEPWTLS